MGRHNPKIGEKVKQGGVTWTYTSKNTGAGGRSLLWETKAKIGMDGGKTVFKRIAAATIEDGVIRLMTARKEFKERQAAEREAADRPTVRQAFEKYIADRARTIEDSTVHTIRCAANHLTDIHNVRLDKLTREQVQAAVDNELMRGAAVSSVKIYVQKLNGVRRFFGLSTFLYIDFKGEISRNGMNKFGGDKAKHFEVPPAKVLEAVEDMGDSDFYNFCVLGLASLRCGEIRGLKYSDIIERGGRHYINIHGQRDCKGKYIPHTKNEGSMREVMLDEEFVQGLDIEGHDPNEYICPKSYTAYNERMCRLKARFDVPDGLKFTAHTLRHIFGTYSDESGEYFFERCKIAGWTTGAGVSERTYRGRNSDRCDEFMSRYYRRLFSRADITVTKTA